MKKAARIITAMRDAVMFGPGITTTRLRAAVARAVVVDEGVDHNLPASWRQYVHKVIHQAYAITDDDIDSLRRAGADDDTIYEVTVTAAVAAGLERFNCGMAALRGGES